LQWFSVPKPWLQAKLHLIYHKYITKFKGGQPPFFFV